METVNEGLRTCGRPSRGRYVQGCRCYMCRVANAEYSLAQSHGENERRMVGRAATESARERVAELIANGWTKRQICKEAGVPRSTLRALLDGHPNTPEYRRGDRAGERRPTAKMGKEAHRAIMALPDRPATADHALVDAAPLSRGLRWALANGRTVAQVARDAGLDYCAVHRLRDAGEGCKTTSATFRRLAPVLLRYATEARDS